MKHKFAVGERVVVYYGTRREIGQWHIVTKVDDCYKGPKWTEFVEARPKKGAK